ncbi:MAG: transporter [Burkholderiales bacterium]|nr:transporter [Burkholderiales bacterium]
MPDARPVAASSYGADDTGLICGYLFAANAPAQAVNTAQALQWLADRGPAPDIPVDDGFVWLHFNLAHAAAEPWLRRHAALPEDFLGATREGSRSSRIERDGDTLFAVINDVTYDFSFDASDIATLWVSVQPRLVISVRRHPLRATDRLRAAVRRGERIDSEVGLLVHLLGDQADELQHIGRNAGERVDHIEDQLLAHRPGQHTAELARLRRLTVRLQRLLAPEPGALHRVLGNPPHWLALPDLQRLREAGDDFGVSLRDVATLQDRIKLLQDEAAARVAEENNRSLFLLTMVTVLALPINLMAGLLGMNVGGVPLAGHAQGFWWMLLVIGGITLGVGWLAWRRLARR